MMRDAYKSRSKNTEGRRHLGNTGVDKRIILKWIFRNNL
jgi:hypothetical protein